MNNKPVSYLQIDSRWKSLPYTTKQENATIGGSGCGPTSMAMVIATWVDPTVTPVDLCNWSMQHGYKATNQGTYYSYFTPQAAAYGLECEQLNWTDLRSASNANTYHQKAHDYVDDGHLVIACMGPGNWTKSGHYILWYSNDGDNVLINDPASTSPTRLKNTFALFKSQVKYYWVVKVPKEVISMTNTEVRELIAQEVNSAVEEAVKSAIGNVEEAIKDVIGNVVTTSDATDPSSWAASSWNKAKSIGVTDGTSPLNPMTREQVITVLDRLGLYGETAPIIDIIKVSLDEFRNSLGVFKATVEAKLDEFNASLNAALNK